MPVALRSLTTVLFLVAATQISLRCVVQAHEATDRSEENRVKMFWGQQNPFQCSRLVGEVRRRHHGECRSHRVSVGLIVYQVTELVHFGMTEQPFHHHILAFTLRTKDGHISTAPFKSIRSLWCSLWTIRSNCYSSRNTVSDFWNSRELGAQADARGWTEGG